MDALTALASRHSTRKFSGKPVDHELIEQIVDAARRAPTAMNVQPWEFIAVTDAGVRQRIADMTDYGKFIAVAPVCIAVFCTDTKYFLEDGAAATENILIAATALGVQSCWIAGDKKSYAEPIRKLLSVPATHRLVSLLPLGYAAEPGAPKDKRPLGDVLHWERFSG